MTDNTPLSLLGDPAFAALWREANDHALTFEEFSTRPMPAGYDCEYLWQAIWDLRRATAVFEPILCFRGCDVMAQWHSQTEAMMRAIDFVAEQTREGAPLSEALQARASRNFVTDSLIREIAVSLNNDDMAIDEDAVRAVILEERPVRTAAEQLAVNIHGLLWDCGRLAIEPAATPEFIEEIYAQVTAGVEDQLPRNPWSIGRCRPDWVCPNPAATLEIICASANEIITSERQHPLENAFLMLCRFWRCAPLERCSCSVGNIFARLYLTRKGYPAFRYISFLTIMDEWHTGRADPAIARVPYDQGYTIRGRDCDWTYEFEIVFQLLAAEVARIDRAMKDTQERDEAILRFIDNDQSINYRQRAVLSRALLAPETRFHVRSHQIRFQVAYSTAHGDLFGLVSRGFLDVDQSQKTAEFTIRPDMRAKLNARREAEKATHRGKRPAN